MCELFFYDVMANILHFQQAFAFCTPFETKICTLSVIVMFRGGGGGGGGGGWHDVTFIILYTTACTCSLSLVKV